MGIDLQPQADRTEVDRLLHQLRSTLARLKAELELAADANASSRGLVDSVNEAIALLSSLERETRDAPLVVVIDDDRRLADAVTQQLQRYGFRVASHATLAELPTNLPNNTKVVVDLSCLRLAKPDDAERIRHLRPVVVTGSSDPLANIEARSYGAAICLLKPVDSTTLWRLLIAEGSTQGALTDGE